jgi:hypothetical protein
MSSISQFKVICCLETPQNLKGGEFGRKTPKKASGCLKFLCQCVTLTSQSFYRAVVDLAEADFFVTG